jgi:hypothetical protein
MNLVLFNQAVELLGVTDIQTFKRDAKRLGCLFVRSGVTKVDVEKFQALNDAEIAKAAEAASKPKAKKRSTGSDLGIISARLARDEKNRQAKQKKIADTKYAITTAATAYERGKLQRDLQKLEDDLKAQDKRHAADEARRDAILSGVDTSESVPQT